MELVAGHDPGQPGDETTFVAAHARGGTGSYGPVSEEVAQCIQSTVGPAAAGAAVEDHADLRAFLAQRVSGHASRALSWAIGAVDCALWDLHSRLSQRPVADLLVAGWAHPHRVAPARRVAVYASWLGLDLASDEALESVRRVTRNGWAFSKWGLRARWPASATAQATRLAAVAQRAAHAAGQPLAFDAVFTWDLALAARFAEQPDLAWLRWIEDPLPSSAVASYARLPTALPVAAGEGLRVDSDPVTLLAHLSGGLTLDVVGCGGLTRAADLTRLAAAAGVQVFPHGRSYVPGIHLAAAFPDTAPAVEYRLQWEPSRQRRYRRPWIPTDGAVDLPDTPGLGADPRRP
ncbi:enolase C-terminal domain-like protein [Geodermatophilus obscurus]|uniref:enolase C-terminal domain-like protein n=1 Tax=Geodermatophilus obscurus TaxID=1861 RepID=UPI00158812B8|nr:enolase C-terminal domain-like protein [Geodermatophilus obscurus]